MLRSIMFALSGVVLSISPAVGNPVETFYKQKNLSLVVGYPPGGGYDAYARLMAEHFPRHVPGRPVVTPQYMPGAATLRAATFVYSVAPQDGTVVSLVGSTLPLNALVYGIGTDAIEITKFNWIGRLGMIDSTGAVWHTTGIKTIEDVKTREVIFGATTPLGGTVTVPLALNRLTGTKINLITGYPGSAEQFLAMERGEIEGMSVVWTQLSRSQPDWVRKKIVPIFQTAYERHPDLADVPTIVELAKNDEDRKVLRILASVSTVGRPFVAGPNVPTERVAALRKAFMDMGRNPQFLAAAEKLRIDIDLLSGEELQAMIAEISSYPKSLFERTKQIVTP